MSKKLCACGCGNEVIGSNKFIHNHHSRGSLHYKWRADNKKLHSCGYILIRCPEHHRADNHGFVPEHVLVLEKALNRPILRTESPHHIDEDKTNNSIANLMLFKTESMHQSYHNRLKAFKSCGHYGWRKCCFCHKWDSLDKLTLRKGGESAYHKACNSAYERARKSLNGKHTRQEDKFIACARAFVQLLKE